MLIHLFFVSFSIYILFVIYFIYSIIESFVFNNFQGSKLLFKKSNY